MVAGERVEDDGLTWRLTLRDGLVFHDDVPVRAQDCVASILRAGKRITTVQTLMGVTNELKALDDKRIEFRLKKRFALLPFALSGVFIMPERIAKTDAFTQISEYVGSGHRYARRMETGLRRGLRPQREIRLPPGADQHVGGWQGLC